MKFRDITKKVNKKDVNLLTGRAVRRTSKKKKKASYGYIASNNDDVFLNVETNPNYKETNGIAGSLNGLPEEVQKFLNNANIKTAKVTVNNSLYVLDNGYSVKITDIVLAGKNKKHIILKHKKKIILDTYLKT